MTTKYVILYSTEKPNMWPWTTKSVLKVNKKNIDLYIIWKPNK